jgi:ribose transport system substrate-binding protein
MSYVTQLFLALGFCFVAEHLVHAQTPPPREVPPVAMSIDAMRQVVAGASKHSAPWSGPESGPAAYAGAKIAIISEDLRNGGILGVNKGIQEAAKMIGWSLKIYDAGGTPAGRSKALTSALAMKPDGVIVVGIDVKEIQAQLPPFEERKIPIVGWHVGPQAGPVVGSPIAMNVSTNPLDVARITAMAAVVASEGRAGVVIFTDSNFEIAMAKSNAMADVIRACKGCRLLEIKDVAISKSAELMPAATQELLKRYGTQWTHALAINDIYFDYAAPELTHAGKSSKSINMLSAGDGSAAAFLRIRAGTFQTGTVSEPLNLHGWQLVDELNRLLAHQPVSGFIIPVHLVTVDNIAFDGGSLHQYDPDNGYRNIYRRIWKR